MSDLRSDCAVGSSTAEKAKRESQNDETGLQVDSNADNSVQRLV